MKYLDIYEQVKHLPEITNHTLNNVSAIPTRNCKTHLKNMVNNGLIKKIRFTHSESGHEMFVYSPIDQTKCSKCKTKGVNLYQHKKCADCLHKEFKTFIPIINQVRK